MGWEPIQSFALSPGWQFTQPVEGTLFRLEYPDQPSIARALIAQAEIVNGKADFYQILRINANQREILQFDKPVCFGERRIAIKQIYGNYQWQLNLEQFMTVSNVTNVQQISAVNQITTSTDARVSLTAATSTLLLAANANRKDATVTLETSGVDVYLKRGATTGLTNTSGAILLTGKGSSFSVGAGDLWLGQISVYCAAAAVLNVTEGV